MLVYRSPQILLLPIDCEKNLIQMPFVPGLRASMFEPIGIRLTKFEAPLPDGFIGEYDTTLGHDLFTISETERETKIQPDTMANNLSGKAKPFVRRS
jgi:hypothetical protein